MKNMCVYEYVWVLWVLLCLKEFCWQEQGWQLASWWTMCMSNHSCKAECLPRNLWVRASVMAPWQTYSRTTHFDASEQVISAVLIMPLPLLSAGAIMFLSCLCVLPCVCQCVHPESLSTYFLNRLGNFHQIYSFGALGEKYELTRFWGRKVKGHGDDQIECSQKRQRHSHGRLSVDFYPVFTARRYASAVLAVIMCPSLRPSVRLSVCPSVTSRSCTKMAKPRIRLTTPYDRPETLVLRCQKSWRNSNDITPNGGAK